MTRDSRDSDVADMRARYRIERDKRLAADRTDLLDLDGVLASYLDDPYSKPESRAAVHDEVDALIVGAGFGGLLAGSYLRKAGLTRIRLVDRAGGVGGVWYWNRYPGVMCDVESYIYLPLLEEMEYIPRHKYALGIDVRAHAEMMADRYGLRADALFQTEVTGASWDESSRRWLISTDRGDAISTRFLVLANGALSKLKLPASQGLERFAGRAFHSSRWDYEFTGGDEVTNRLSRLADKVVGVVGTGASAVQCVPPLARSSKHLYVFQRTPSTVAVRANRPTDPTWASSLAPGWQYERLVNFTTIVSGGYAATDLVNDGWTDVYGDVLLSPKYANVPRGDAASAVELADLAKMDGVRTRIDETVKSKRTADALKPYYRYLCKRPTFHDEYLESFNLPNVTLVDTEGRGLDEVYDHGVIANGVKFPLDCIVFATGFEFGTPYTHRIGFDIVGRDRVSLTSKWSEGYITLHGLMTSGFPNLFVIPGPGAQSSVSVNLMHSLWENAAHLGYIVENMTSGGHAVFEVTPASEQHWVERVVASIGDNSKYLADCTPGRKNNEGLLDDRIQRNADYGGGAIAFFRLLQEWRDDRSMAGLRFED